MIRSLGLLLAAVATPLAAQSTITERSVAAHEAFLASDALQGRGSATRDEAIAAAYVASQFQAYGLTPAPGMNGYLQSATIVREKLASVPSLTIGGANVPAPTLLFATSNLVEGPLTITSSGDPAKLPTAPVILVTSEKPDAIALYRAASAKGVKLLLLVDNASTRSLIGMLGGGPRLPTYLEGSPKENGPALVLVAPAAMAVVKAGAQVSLKTPLQVQNSVTTNAIGFLEGSDPKSGTLLLTAHLDHLGVRPDGTIMHGANDDASGTTAVLELAKSLATGKQPKRNILFVCYGAEEIGGFGSKYFGAHPPVPLTDFVANIEFEMIGSQDPKLPKDTLMMTGFERSNLGRELKAHGGLVAGDPYPDQHFFERSDNYSLAVEGVVAHTVSGWAVVPTYHQPTDTAANLNIPFMTAAIRSLVKPVEWLANTDFVPAWSPRGKPEKR